MTKEITEKEFYTEVYNRRIKFVQDLYSWSRRVGYPIKWMGMQITLFEEKEGEK